MNYGMVGRVECRRKARPCWQHAFQDQTTVVTPLDGLRRLTAEERIDGLFIPAVCPLQSLTLSLRLVMRSHCNSTAPIIHNKFLWWLMYVPYKSKLNTFIGNIILKEKKRFWGHIEIEQILSS